jgi:hypothetical protein
VGIDRTFGIRPSGIRHELSLALFVQNGLGKNGARRISGAKEEDAIRTLRRLLSHDQAQQADDSAGAFAAAFLSSP